MKATILFVCTQLFILNNIAQSVDVEKLNAYFDLIEENDKAIGAISIFKSGSEVYHRTIGYADLENNNKANEYTQYRIGSITKSITAAIVLQLIEEGKLTLETKLSDYFTSVPNYF